MSRTVTRFVVTYQKPGEPRTLLGPAQGRFTYATREEAERFREALRQNNDPARLIQLYGGENTLQVRECICWAGHFDPVGIYFPDKE